MKRRYWIIFLVLFVGSLLYGYGAYLAHKKAEENSRISVGAAKSIQQNAVLTYETIGQVTPISTVVISSQVDGVLESVNFKEGDIVQKGQMLFQIDPRPYQAKLAQAQALLETDQAKLKNAQLMLDRSKALLKKGFLSQQDFDQNKYSEESLEAAVKADQAAVEEATLNLNYCTIISPVTGKTGNLLVNIGNVVSSTNRTALITINQLSPIYVSFSLPEKFLPQLQAISKQNLLSVNALLEGKQETGTLSFINNTIDNTTGTIQLKATFNNTAQNLWPGQFVKIIVPIQTFPQAILVPTEAVQQGQEGAYVYVINQKKHQVHYQLVTPGPEIGNNTLIQKGLSPNEWVVTKGYLRLQDGSHVRIQ